MDNLMTAKHAAGKVLVDPVFSVVKAAKNAVEKYGVEKVVNATAGTIYDDQESFSTFSTVAEVMDSLSSAQMMNYAPIAGIPGYGEAAIKFVFGDYRPDSYLSTVATPGGTGALRHVFFNYADEGDTILIPDWFWGPYQIIAGEFKRNVDSYQLFTEENNFNIESLQQKVSQMLKQQDRLIVVFNNPAHNPTGFSLNEEEWKATLDFFRDVAKDKSKHIVLLLDVAYMDYAGEPDKVREFFSLFGDLPDNILVTVAFSMSKAFLAYGLRCGAIIAVSSSNKVIEEFQEAASYSNRANWSNVSRLPQELFVTLTNDSELIERVSRERQQLRRMIEARAAVFTKEAKQIGLDICPYTAGFFISIPSDNPQEQAKRLQEQFNIFLVPLKKGLRYAICSIPISKVSGLAQKTKQVMEG